MKQFIQLLFLITLWLAPNSNWAKDSQLKISLLTCSTGEELYSTFGHSALRVKYLDLGKDVVYDFGIFDFKTPNFLLKFLKGSLDYRLSVRSFQSFLDEYKRADRHIIEQELNVTDKVKNDLVEKVNNVYNSDARFYRYNFLHDNCSTRIRDLIFGLELDLNKIVDEKKEVTFRDNLKSYLQEKPWTRFGIDVLLGAPTDHVMDTKQQLYLPYQLSQEMSKYNVAIGSSNDPLFGNPKIIHQAKWTKTYLNILTPTIVFWVCFLVIGLGVLLQPVWVKFFGPIVYAIYGLIGLIIAFMWFGTMHDATKINWNILWANPLYLISPFFFKSLTGINYLRVVTGISLLYILLWFFIPQELNPAVIPLILLLVIINSMAIQLKLSNDFRLKNS